MAGKSRNATALRRYFLSQELICYSWTSDQFAQYGTKVVPATIRVATYATRRSSTMPRSWRLSSLRRILLALPTLVFALFDLLRMQFAPRLRDKGTLKHDLLLRLWDDFLRLAGSLKLSWVTASLFISKLQAYPRQNILTRALQEYGRLIKL